MSLSGAGAGERWARVALLAPAAAGREPSYRGEGGAAFPQRRSAPLPAPGATGAHLRPLHWAYPAPAWLPGAELKLGCSLLPARQCSGFPSPSGCGAPGERGAEAGAELLESPVRMTGNGGATKVPKGERDGSHEGKRPGAAAELPAGTAVLCATKNIV